MALSEHPYAPQDLQLPGFIPNLLPMTTILLVYVVASMLVVFLTWLFSGRCTSLTKIDRTLMCWWIFTGLTHTILEGYFAFSPEFFKEKTPCYLAEVCNIWVISFFIFSPSGKEYSKGDSRYVSRNSAVVTVEGITAVLEGPASLWAMYSIATRKPYSYTLQLMISLGQLYGTAVYYITSFLDGDHFAANSFYYWAYFVGANFSWIVIPSLISVRCWKKISAALQAQKKKNKTH